MSQEELARANRLVQAAQQERLKADSRSRLQRIVAKKFRTAFIFPLAEFEKAFGTELWGHGMPEEGLTDEQRANQQRWEQVRVGILNNGNTQARAVLAELELHDVLFKGYRVDLGGTR